MHASAWALQAALLLDGKTTVPTVAKAHIPFPTLTLANNLSLPPSNVSTTTTTGVKYSQGMKDIGIAKDFSWEYLVPNNGF